MTNLIFIGQLLPISALKIFCIPLLFIKLVHVLLYNFFCTLLWDDITIICWWNKLLIGPKQVFLSQFKKVSDIFIQNYCDIIPKWRTKILFKRTWTSFLSRRECAFQFFVIMLLGQHALLMILCVFFFLGISFFLSIFFLHKKLQHQVYKYWRK